MSLPRQVDPAGSARRRLRLILAGTALLCSLGLFAGGDADERRLTRVRLTPIALDLARPDALIVTRNLAALPRDILRAPLAREVLTEDFVFYYEQHEDRLGLKGTLRRIAFEHELELGDRLLQAMLDEPAEVALWRGRDGRAEHYLIAMTRNGIAKLVQQIAEVAYDDSQLSVAALLDLPERTVPVLALRYGNDRSLLFVADGDRMVIASSAGVLLDDSGVPQARARLLAALLSPAAEGQAVFRDHFGVRAGDAQHVLVATADFLSFGYQRFFPALRALRFDFAQDVWRSAVRADAESLRSGAFDDRAIWQALPAEPSACALLPVIWASGREILKVGPEALREAAAPLLDALSGPAGVCWYSASRLNAPVIVATLKEPATAEVAAALVETFSAILRRGSLSEASSQALGNSSSAGARVWVADVPVRQGDADYRVALAVSGRYLVFSPDQRLVHDVLATLAKRASAIADDLSDTRHTLAFIAPADLAKLVEREAFDALPAADEPVLRNAASQHLLPRLKALARYPRLRVALVAGDSSSGEGWHALDWQSTPR